MRLVFEADAEVGAWMAARLPMVQTVERIGRYRAIGVVDDEGQLGAGMFYHRWNDLAGDIELGIVIENPRLCQRRVIHSLLRFPFLQLSCQRVTTVTAARNIRCLRFTDGIGFVREGLIRRGFVGDDAVRSGLLREDWLAGPYGSRVAL